jgi:hypothetical protein
MADGYCIHGGRLPCGSDLRVGFVAVKMMVQSLVLTRVQLEKAFLASPLLTSRSSSISQISRHGKISETPGIWYWTYV